jgi:hypothetical protein
MFNRDRRYFISYATPDGGHGNQEVVTKPIRSMKDIQDIEKNLSEALNRQIVVIGWHRWR